MGIYSARISGVATASAAAKTIVQVAAGATKRVKIKELGISFDGVDTTKTPVGVDLVRQTTAGTMTALTIVEQEEALEAAIATAQHTATAEPTTTDVLRSWYVSPAGGLLIMQFPLGDEPVVGLSGRLALRAVTVSGSGTPNCSAYIVFEE